MNVDFDLITKLRCYMNYGEIGMSSVSRLKTRGGARFYPTGGLGSLTEGLNNRIEGIFLCIITQFSVKNSPTDRKYFPDEGLTLPDEGATAPPVTLMRHPCLRQRFVKFLSL